MGILAAGQVLIVHFPFSDLSQSKLRPAVVLAEAGRGDWLLCQITSKSYGDSRAIQIAAGDFAQGSLRVTSFARPGKLFTAHASLIAGQIGELHSAKFSAIRDAAVRLIQSGQVIATRLIRVRIKLFKEGIPSCAEKPFREMKIIFRRERERDRPGCRHRRPADGFRCGDIKANGSVLPRRTVRRDADQSMRDACAPRTSLRLH